MSVTLEVAEFVLARIAEAEADAKAVEGDKSWDVDPVNGSFAQVVSSDGAVAGGVQTLDAIHIARWDPAHVLTQCTIHRAIVEEWLEAAARTDAEGRPAHWSDVMLSTMLKSHGRWIVMLAMAHTDHPDYNPEWHTRILDAEERAFRRRSTAAFVEDMRERAMSGIDVQAAADLIRHAVSSGISCIPGGRSGTVTPGGS